MGRRIRWLGVVLLAGFALVIVQLVNIQFRQAGALANSPNNPRIAAQKYDNARGTITAADGTVLAKSVKTTAAGSTSAASSSETESLSTWTMRAGTSSWSPAAPSRVNPTSS